MTGLLATTIFSNATNFGNLVGFFTFGAFVHPLGNRGLFLVSATLTALTIAEPFFSPIASGDRQG